MGGGSGGGNTTTTQKADPWSGVQPYLTNAYSQADQLYQPGQGPAYFPGQTVAPASAAEAAGQQMLSTAATGSMTDVANQTASNFGTASGLGTAGGASGLGLIGQGVAGMSNLASQTAGGASGANSALQQLLGYGYNGSTQAGTGGTVNAMNQLAQAGDPANNPYFQSALTSAIRPVTQQFQEQVLPGIKNGAMDAGQLGGSRQGVAEGIASRGYLDTVGDISANMGNSAYAQGLQALQASGQLGQGLTSQGLGALNSAGALGGNLANLSGQLQTGIGSLGQSTYGTGLNALGQQNAIAPNVQQAISAPGQTQLGVGQQQTAYQQALMDADQQKWNYQQNLPYTMISDYLSMLNGAQGGSTTAQQSGGGSSKAMGALGGAATGATIGSAFGPIGTGVGAAAGGLYGLFA